MGPFPRPREACDWTWWWHCQVMRCTANDAIYAGGSR